MYVRNVHNDEDAAVAPRRAATAHICVIPGCSMEIPSRHLMCPKHWFEVPGELRDQVNDAFAAWLAGRRDVRPYLVARLKAIIAVSKLHNIDASADEAKLARWEKKES